MKSFILVLTLISAAFSANATTLALDYSYLRSTDGSYLAGHAVVASVKQKFGTLGNAKVFGGTIQSVTGIRDNGNVFGAEYSYDFTTSVGVLSPEVGLQRVTGTVNGVDTAYVGAKLRTTLAPNTRLVTGVVHTEALGSNKPGRTTSAGAGVEFDISKSLTLKGGYVYTRLHTLERNANGLVAGIDFKF